MLLKACIGVLCCRESKYTVLVTSSSIRQKTSEMGQLPVCIWVLMFTTPQMWMVRVHWRCIYRKLFLRGQAREINKSMLSVRSSYLKITACAHLKACCFPRYSVGYHAFSLIWKGIGVQFGKSTMSVRASANDIPGRKQLKCLHHNLLKKQCTACG